MPARRRAMAEPSPPNPAPMMATRWWDRPPPVAGPTTGSDATLSGASVMAMASSPSDLVAPVATWTYPS